MGIMTQNHMRGMRDVWGMDKFLTQGAVPAYEDLDYTFAGGFKDFTPALYIEMARQFPNATFSTFTSNADLVQVGYLILDGQVESLPAFRCKLPYPCVALRVFIFILIRPF